MYEELVEYNGREYLAMQDLDSEDPREWNGNSEPAMYILGDSRTRDPMAGAENSHELIELFETLYNETFVYDDGERFYDKDGLAEYMEEYEGEVNQEVLEAYDDWIDALDAGGTQAYVDVVNKLNRIEGISPGDVLEVHSATGFSQGDYLVILCAGSAGQSDFFEASAEVLGQWIFGSVWVVEDVETGDAVGGIYADFADEAVREYAEEHR